MTISNIRDKIWQNKLLIALLPFLVAWAVFITRSVILHPAEVLLIAQQVEAKDKLASQKVEEIKKDIEELKTNIKDHSDKNDQFQQKMYDILLNINKNVKEKK